MVDLALERKARGMTQHELSLKAKISRSYIALLETDPERVPSVATARKLAKALDLKWTDFFE